MTAADPKRRGLGRGLSALLGEDTDIPYPSESTRHPQTLPIEELRPGRFQPRKQMDPEALEELAHSIAERGILQPILVRPLDDGSPGYEIIAGERRWRAAQLAALHDVPVLVRDLGDREAQEIALIENLQREDLSPLEEAEGYRRLMEDHGHTQEELATSLGRSRSHVANTLRLLSLPAELKDMLAAGTLSAGHARALLTSADPHSLAKTVVNRGLNVRQTEALASASKGSVGPRNEPQSKDADTLALERDLGALLGIPVEIRFRGAGAGGALVLNYRTLEQLDDILHRLTDGARGRTVEPGEN